MKRLLLFVLLSISLNTAFPQMMVVYGIRNNGKEMPNDSIVIYTMKESLRITKPMLKKEQQYIDFKSGQTIQFLENSENGYFAFRKTYETKFHEIAHDYSEILGYPCMKTTLNIRSNKVEVFYTDMAENYGAPLLYLAEIPGLVLKVIRNDSYEIYAKKIINSEGFINEALIPTSNITELSEGEFQQKLIESRYKTFEIFRNENLNFNNDHLSDFTKDVIRTAKGSVVIKKVNLPNLTENTIVIAEVTVRSNGDAYDRTGSVFAIPITGMRNFIEAFKEGIDALPKYKNDNEGIVLTEDYEPPLELIRFMTSFGTGSFGKDIKIGGLEWKDSIVYRLDITDISLRG